MSPEGIFATSVRRPRPALATAFLAGAALLQTGCSVQAEPTSHSVEGGYPSAHVHGMSVDPGTNRVLLATHDGLFNVSASSVVQVGPTIDLMGFTHGANGDLYASGHPGPGAGLPDPVGLIRSTDEGRTWQPLSLQGESDFHALAATSGGFVGFDGTLRTSPDGVSWETVEQQIPAYNLAGTPRGAVVLATTEEGLQRSTDHGKSWASVPDAPLLMFTALSDGKAAGITPDGEVHTSSDAGLTWEKQGTVPGEAAAVAIQVIEESVLRIWVATHDGVQVSNDNGRTFSDIRANRR